MITQKKIIIWGDYKLYNIKEEIINKIANRIVIEVREYKKM